MNAIHVQPVVEMGRRFGQRPAAVVVCTCGQDLDVVGGVHCPRCGITLRHGHNFDRAA